MDDEILKELEETLNFYTSSTVESIINNERLSDYERACILTGYRCCQNDVKKSINDLFEGEI